MEQSPFEELLAYRRAVADMYARLRQSSLSEPTRCEQFRRERDKLFATHPQSALSDEQKANFTGLRYYPYNPSCAYNPRWHCPLAPPENHLPLAVTAGEQQYLDLTDYDWENTDDEYNREWD